MSANTTRSISNLPDLCHALTHSSPFPMAMVEGVDQVLRHVNPAFCRLVGEAEGTLLGTSIAACLPHSDGCLSILARVNRTGEPESHTEQRTAERQLVWSYSVWPVLPEGERPLGAMILITETSEFHQQATAMNQALMVSAVRQHELAEAADILAVQMSNEIAERKRSEQELGASESRLSLALESAKASTWEWDVEMNSLRWSDAIRALPGFKKNSREASYEAWRASVYPEDRAAVDSARDQAANCSPRINVEFRVQDGDGSICWMLIRGRLGRVEGGRAMTYSGIILDITERKHGEQALLRSEKLNGVGRMAATLAHEINNPLDAVMNAVYLAKLTPGVPEPAHHFLDIADEELRRVAHMARQSLGFYRESISPTTFSVDTLLDSALGLLKNRINVRSITIERQSDEDLNITGVFGELRQVFVNLISNSLDVLDKNGTIKLRTSLSTSLRDGRQRVRITVADNGKGIGVLQLTRVFEPFFTTKGELGTGLGLWVTKQLVEKHGGAIQVRSCTKSPHVGTVFSITLPTD